MDLFATISRSQFVGILKSGSLNASSDRPAYERLLEEFEREGSTNFTTTLTYNSKVEYYRLNVASSDNGQRARIIARKISDTNYPTISELPCGELLAARGRATKHKERWVSVPAADLLDDRRPQTGLIVVFGGTGSGKSFIADSIANHIVCPSTRPVAGHILRAGDPVEGLLGIYSKPDPSLGSLGTSIVETQRNLVADYASSERFRGDALRQKPTLVTISEMREEKELVEAINLGATGHLVVATAHAGSLEDGFLRLMKAYGCFQQRELRTPLVKSLNTLIYLDVVEVEVDSVLYRVSRPSVWTRTETSEKRFIADGINHLNPSSTAEAPCRSPMFFYRDIDGRRERLEWAAAISGLDISNTDLIQHSIQADSLTPDAISDAVQACLRPWMRLIPPVFGSSVARPSLGRQMKVKVEDEVANFSMPFPSGTARADLLSLKLQVASTMRRLSSR